MNTALKEEKQVSEVRPSPSADPRGLVILQALVIVIATLWIFAPVFHGDWLWDDDLYLRNNPLLHESGRLWKAWFQPGSFIEYYPIEETVQWVQWQFFGDNTFGYYLTNVFLHIVSSLLVWRLLAKMGLQLAWLGGLIFALHPSAVESVAWIAELKNTLSLPPFLLAMCAWIDFEEHGHSRDYRVALAWFLVAMLCKISMAPFPFVILLYAWWKRGRLGWRDLKVSVPFFALSLLLGLTTLWAGQIFAQTHPEPTDHVPLGGLLSRLACVGLSLSLYFFHFIWPVNLVPIYPHWNITPPSLWQFSPWLILAGVGCGLWRERHGWGRHVLLGLGFFALMLSPFLGFVPISYMYFTWVMDHFLYIPIIGLIGLVVAALPRIDERLPGAFRSHGVVLLAGVMTLLALESHGYAAFFASQKTLWTYIIEQNPGAWTAHNNLGLVLLQAGDGPGAIAEFEEALTIRPDDAESCNNLGFALIQAGKLNDGMERFRQALALNPRYAEAASNLGVALKHAGQLDAAMEQFRRALQINPAYADAHVNLGDVLVHTGKKSEGMAEFQQALRLNPNSADAHNDLGNLLKESGHISEAMEHYREALRLNPHSAEVRNNLGGALLAVGLFPEAIEQYQAAVGINPGLAPVHRNLGIAFMRNGQPDEAVRQFELTLQINPTDAAARGYLALLQPPQKALPSRK